MPSVNLSPETYEKLVELARRRGASPEDIAEVAVAREFRDRPMSSEEWLAEWDSLVASIRSRIPSETTSEELEADLSAAVAWARERRRARSH